MKFKLLYFATLCFLLFACTQTKETVVAQEVPAETAKSLQIIDKGVKTFFLDEKVNFQKLQKLQLAKISGKEYLAYYDFRLRTIYIHDYENGEIFNEIKLAPEGPNEVRIHYMLDFFLHSLDSIFIDSQSATYYLINDKAEVLNQIGKTSKTFGEPAPVSFEKASYFADNQIHGNYRIPYPRKTDDFIYARASLKLQPKLEVTRSLKTSDFIDSFDDLMNYRSKKNPLFTIPRHFTWHAPYLYASSPISDSIRVFKDSNLSNTLYAGVSGFDKMDFEDYLNINQVKRKKGEVRKVVTDRQDAYYINMEMDPAGKYIYRVLMHGTRPSVNTDDNEQALKVKGATLIVIEVDTGKLHTMDLPIDEIEMKVPWNPDVFVSKAGIHFRVKDQENEDQVQFRVFGPSF